MTVWTTEALLAALAGIDGCRTVAAIAQTTGRGRREVAKACGKLLSRGLVERPRAGCYELTNAGRAAVAAGARVRSGPAGPHTGPRRPRRHSLQARLWSALRKLGKASVPDLVALAADGGERDAAGNARRYLKALLKAGYVVEMPRAPGTAPTSNGFKRYLLVTDPGPYAPVLNTGRGTIRDRNTGKVIDLNAEDPK